MKKGKRHVLYCDEEEIIDWIGLCSSHSDYRLAWGLNQALSLRLIKQDDMFQVSRKGIVQSEHSYYFCDQAETLASYYLIKNKCDGKFLIPEKPQIDFFLVLKNGAHIEIELMLNQVKSVNGVFAAFSFESASLPSSEWLIFE